MGGSPLASLWGAPGLAVSQVGNPSLALWIGVATIVVLAIVWWGLVALSLRPTRALHLDRQDRVPGWFRGLPPTPAGAVAARSFIYWVRDPRYRVVFGILPILPIVTILAFWVGGVPRDIAAFVPLPLMVLVLAWSTIHNDIAYDSTAMWSAPLGADPRHPRPARADLAGARVRRHPDRHRHAHHGLGPGLDPASLPAVLGINIALLLGGVGVGSAMSVRLPYPAPRPGDGPFTYPQASGGTGGGAQGGSFFLTILVAAAADRRDHAVAVGLPRSVAADRPRAPGSRRVCSRCCIGIRAGGVGIRPSWPGTAGLHHAKLGDMSLT